MRTRTLSQLTRVVILVAAACWVSSPVFGISSISSQAPQSKSLKEPDQLLMAIYHEVQELGYREQEDFIKREFHFNLDGSMANQEEHVVVLSHPDGNGEKMILQVTYFGESAREGIAHYSTETREICCLIEGNTIEIQQSGFEIEEARLVLPEILKGIQAEKKVLKLLEHKR